MFPCREDLNDQHLVQIVDAGLSDAARRSGAWLACRPGCTQCCNGTFAINQLDAQRLRLGLSNLEVHDPARAIRVRARGAESIARLSADFPGHLKTGILHETEDAQKKFEDFGNEETCPLLDPDSGLCDLYAARPMTCRIFGPPVRSGEENGLGVCELCYRGASAEQIASCEMVVDPANIENVLLEKLEKLTGLHGKTIVAFCLQP
ncbi:MAG: YkgJ family cysteine cluster protein [Acidobacteriia bacterium]|nr:YkgJ family cysteine cluster protein [Terriglobia bacterium]